MIKILLKEPVGGGVSPGGTVGLRQTHYMLAQGDINEETEKMFSAALSFNDSLLFVAPTGHQFLIPAANVAYIMETDEKPTG